MSSLSLRPLYILVTQTDYPDLGRLAT